MTAERDHGSPTVQGLLRNGWNTLHTIYYANSVSWRVLKSGALFFFGFFLWAGGNAILSVRPDVGILHYVIAYGFVLIAYGPFHHIVVIPLAIRWRRQGGNRGRIGRRLPNASLVVFAVIVVLLGTFPVGPVTADLGGGPGGGVDINPDLTCTKHTASNGTVVVHCHLTEASGIDHVVVISGGETLQRDDQPPFELTLSSDRLSGTGIQRRFIVDLREPNGDLIRRYSRTLGMIREAE